MGRLERDLKKKVKGTKKDYAEWYSEHERQILQRTEEANSEVDRGNIKVKKRVPVKVWIIGGAAILLATVITLSVLLIKTEKQSSGIPDFTFGAEELYDNGMSSEEIEDVVTEHPQLANLEIVGGVKALNIKNGSLVMNTLNCELETESDFYMVEVRIAYTDNFFFLDKTEYEELENKAVIGGTEIEYEAKGTDSYGMYLYYAVTYAKEATLYWRVSSIEGLFDEWLQVVFD